MAELLTDREAVVFDAYGTLLDVHSAVQRHADRVGPDAARFSELWRTKQVEYSWIVSLMGRYRCFWSMTEQALDYALAVHPDVDRSLRAPLLEAYRDLDAFPDVPATLTALRERGIRTAILSNGNTEMLDRAVTSAGIKDHLDAVMSVDAAQIFKTHPRTYAIVLDQLDVMPDRVLFCSSNRWDIAGATAFGFACAWVNRRGLPDEYPDLQPVAVIGSLDDLR